jgi:hypothetical protein
MALPAGQVLKDAKHNSATLCGTAYASEEIVRSSAVISCSGDIYLSERYQHVPGFWNRRSFFRLK